MGSSFSIQFLPKGLGPFFRDVEIEPAGSVLKLFYFQ